MGSAKGRGGGLEALVRGRFVLVGVLAYVTLFLFLAWRHSLRDPLYYYIIESVID